MGLSAFSRARVSQLPVLEAEAKRFDEWNKAHQAGFRAIDELHEEHVKDESIDEIRKADMESVATMGEKAEAGLPENTAEGDPVDKPLREDHTREIVGRLVDDPQGEPKSTMDRLHERIPESGGEASIALVGMTSVESDGPSKEEINAARAEQLPDVSNMTDAELDAEIARLEAQGDK